MFNPFSTPKNREEWRARTRAIQERLEGLSIAELMRGITKGVSSGRAGHEYDPNQPRVPAGHPDGGQWTNKAKLGGERINDPRVISDERLTIIGSLALTTRQGITTTRGSYGKIFRCNQRRDKCLIEQFLGR